MFSITYKRYLYIYIFTSDIYDFLTRFAARVVFFCTFLFVDITLFYIRGDEREDTEKGRIASIHKETLLIILWADIYHICTLRTRYYVEHTQFRCDGEIDRGGGAPCGWVRNSMFQGYPIIQTRWARRVCSRCSAPAAMTFSPPLSVFPDRVPLHNHYSLCPWWTKFEK